MYIQLYEYSYSVSREEYNVVQSIQVSPSDYKLTESISGDVITKNFELIPFKRYIRRLFTRQKILLSKEIDVVLDRLNLLDSKVKLLSFK